MRCKDAQYIRARLLAACSGCLLIPLDQDCHAAGWGASDGHGKRRLAGGTASHAAAAAQSNATWLEDCVIRLMCVLALDRFGDFVGDQVLVQDRRQKQSTAAYQTPHTLEIGMYF